MDLQIFNYEQKQVRTAVDSDGETLFVAKDLCDVLGILKYRDAVSNLEEDERLSIPVDTLGGKQAMIAVTESGLYSLIFISKHDKAKAFKKWVTSEVIPSIRKTGSYVAPKPFSFEFIKTETRAAIELAEMYDMKGNQAKLSAAKAMKLHHNIDVQNLIGVTHLISESQEAELTPTELGKKIGLSAQGINKLLAENNLQEKVEDKWIVTNKGRRFAVVLDTGKKHSNGAPVQQIKWKESVIEEIREEEAA